MFKFIDNVFPCRTVTISSISQHTEVRTTRGNNPSALPYTDLMVHPPAYSALFSATQFSHHMPQSEEEMPHKLPVYGEPSCNPPAYTICGMTPTAPGAPTLIPTGTLVTPQCRDVPPPIYSASVINVEPPSNTRDILSPPPAYDDSTDRRERQRRSQRRTRRIIQ